MPPWAGHISEEELKKKILALSSVCHAPVNEFEAVGLIVRVVTIPFFLGIGQKKLCSRPAAGRAAIYV